MEIKSPTSSARRIDQTSPSGRGDNADTVIYEREVVDQPETESLIRDAGNRVRETLRLICPYCNGGLVEAKIEIALNQFRRGWICYTCGER